MIKLLIFVGLIIIIMVAASLFALSNKLEEGTYIRGFLVTVSISLLIGCAVFVINFMKIILLGGF